MGKKKKKAAFVEGKVEEEIVSLAEKKVETKEDKEIKEVEEFKDIKGRVKALLIREHVTAEANDTTRDLYDRTRYGEPLGDKFQYALVEALYLMERGKFEIVDNKGKIVNSDSFIRSATKIEPNFWIRYCVFGDLRKRGYIVKTALKFGADFRVYERGIKPGEEHAKWIVYPVSEGEVFGWYDFAAKNRVAHSTRKRLLIGIVDVESDVTYYEIAWKRP